MPKYNPDKMPTTLKEWDALIEFKLAEEAQKVKADPDYQPYSRAHFETVYACYYPEAVPAPEPELTFEDKRRLKLDELDCAFQDACGAAITDSSGFIINADETANRNVDGLIKKLEATGSTGPVNFCLYDNSFAEVDLATLKAFQLAIIEKGQELYARKWQLRTAIVAAQDEAALAAIQIGF